MIDGVRRGLPWLSALLLLGVPAVRGWLESRMSLHMALELPLLLTCGWSIADTRAVRGALLERVDHGGLLAATTASCVLAAWMVQAALDWAVLEPCVAWLKYGMWMGAGALLHAARLRLTPVVQAFFLGNAAWMTTTAGLLYLDAERQLCVNYLVDDQQVAGWALVFWGAVLGTCALHALRPVVRGEHPTT
jgi:hypothetical protein